MKIKSQPDPNKYVRDTVAESIMAEYPRDSMNHATKYPSGVLQLNGHLVKPLHHIELSIFILI